MKNEELEFFSKQIVPDDSSHQIQTKKVFGLNKILRREGSFLKKMISKL
ncbi:MAG: hypothetical protein ACTSP3_00130 [Candidatus Heimdallarchaeaceae archaeon]